VTISPIRAAGLARRYRTAARAERQAGNYNRAAFLSRCAARAQAYALCCE